MARRRRIETEPTHQDRWLVSYADFITLLFAFFVVMYAISSVNEGKYRVLSNTIVGAFQDPARSLNPVQVGELRRTSGLLTGDTGTQIPTEGEGAESSKIPERPDVATAPLENRPPPPLPVPSASDLKRLANLSNALEKALAPYMKDQSVSVINYGAWVEVNMRSSLLFPSGESRLTTPAISILRDVSQVLAATPHPVQVVGYTDNVPINTPAFPSNWELSAARAASVVHLFTRLGLDPKRLAAVGYGEHRPIGDNATEEGRRQNRRVILVINLPDSTGGQPNMGGARPG